MGLDDGFVMHAPVGTFGPNGFGLHDTHGGVWEWCRDGFDDYRVAVAKGDGQRQVQAPRDRVFRGGCFNRTAVYARSANRSLNAPGFRLDYLGLRGARGITE